jgi:peptidoglycan-associated lipoprotein
MTMRLGQIKNGGQIALVGLALLLVAGCRSGPSSEGVAGTGPEVGEETAPLTETTPERVTDPFGSEAGDLEETDITASELEGAGTDLAWAEGQLETVYFEFDRASLTEQARAALDRNAAFLTANLGLNVRIEGHCDERGTIEYNLALGDRRASSAKEYLVQRGVAAERLEVVSYGEERPADPGRNEAAWARNRRAEFHVR